MTALSNKTALITGGGSGIGAAIATAFAEAGCKVAICGRRIERLQDVAQAAKGTHPIACRAADVSELDQVSGLVGWAREQLGKIDILVNAAGINVKKRMMRELSPEDYNRMMQINANAVFYTLREVLPEMRQRRDGLVINICSISGIRAGQLGGVGYNASKFALAAIGQTVGDEEKENGIRVTTIHPGEVDTPILEERPNPVSAEHRARILRPEDVAAAALMVACLPSRARVPELVICPTIQSFV